MRDQSREAVYTEPVITDGGDVVEVTLGHKYHDSDDDTRYKFGPDGE